MFRFAFILLVIINFPTKSQEIVKCEILKNTGITISGKSNLGKVHFYQNCSNFVEKNLTLTIKKTDSKLYIAENELHIPVKKFESDNLPALLDFRKMLCYDQYPEITIKLLYVDLKNIHLDNHEIQSTAIVNISLTGKSKNYNIPVIANITKNSLFVKGERQINITDYDIKPVSELFGLIKVSEWITIHFNIELKYALIN